MRELREELGIHVLARSATHLCRLVAEPAPGPVVVSAWLVRGWEGTPANLAPEEHDDIGWFDIDDAPPLAHAPVRAALVAAIGSAGGSDAS